MNRKRAVRGAALPRLANVTSFSGRFLRRHGVVDEFVQLGIDTFQGRRQLGWQGHGTVLKGDRRRGQGRALPNGS
jgi:hypothetical protein